MCVCAQHQGLLTPCKDKSLVHQHAVQVSGALADSCGIWVSHPVEAAAADSHADSGVCWG